MSKEKYSKKSVDIIYENAWQIGYRKGFGDGYDKCKEDLMAKLESL